VPSPTASGAGGYVLALIPARGGSKSIPLKNLAPLGGRPLISYVIEAARQCPVIDALVCSTDHEQIADFCRQQGVRVLWRPAELSGDEVPVAEVMSHVLGEHQAQHGFTPELVPLLQPTSPFLLPEHIEAAVRLLRDHPEADSAQTITTFPHNYHAFNQRRVEGPRVRFCFPEERARCYNKQSKPTHYVFGNLVVSRSSSLLSGRGVFGLDSVFVEIARPYAFDVDEPSDLEYAEHLLRCGRVQIPDAGQRTGPTSS
jgi:CMP-N-acetylneuraminic acid synthetase